MYPEIPPSLLNLVEHKNQSYDPSTNTLTVMHNQACECAREDQIQKLYEKNKDEERSFLRSSLRNMDPDNYGVSTRIGPDEYTPYVRPVAAQIVETAYDHYLVAREAYINGKTENIEAVVKWVREDDGPKYDSLVLDEEGGELAVHKHRIDWRRWFAWWWLARRYCRDLGRPWHG